MFVSELGRLEPIDIDPKEDFNGTRRISFKRGVVLSII